MGKLVNTVYRIVLAAVLALFFAGNASAQISGTVTDKQKKPVPYATVLLYNTDITGGTPKAYAITDNDGRFKMNTKLEKGNWAVVRCVGFKEQRKELDPKRHSFTFYLEEDIKSLKEVTVKSSFYGISVAGDTVKFSTDYFKNGTEETAGELIGKIPGVEVSEGGDVTYAGKKVDKVLLDGKEIFINNGQVLMNNLSADAVKGAELLTKYNDGSLAEEFRDGDQTALNIKTDGKGRTSGNVRMLAGITNAYDVSGNMLHTGGKWSVSANISANNLDKGVTSGASMAFYQLDNSLSSNDFVSFSSADEDLMSLSSPATNVYQADKGMLSLDVSYHHSKKINVKSRFIGNASLTKSEKFSEQLYAATGATNYHSLEQTNSGRLFDGHVRIFYQPSKKWEFTSLTQVSYNGSRSDYIQSDYGFVRKLNIFSDDTTDRFSFKEEVVCHHKIGKGLLSPHISFQMTNRAEENQLWTDSAMLPVTYVCKGDSLGLHLGIQNLQRSLKSDVTYSLPVTKNIKMKTTVTWEHGRNDYSYQELRHFMDEDICSAHISLSNRNGMLNYSLRVSAIADLWQTDIQEMERGFTPYLTASANVSLHFKPTHSLSLTARNGRSPIGLTMLLRDTLIESYSSMHGGSEITDPFSKSANVSMNYRIRNIHSGTGFYANASYTHRQCFATTNYQQDGLLGITFYDNKGESQSFYFNMSVSQALKFIPVEARLSGSFNRSANEGKVNGEKVPTLYDNYSTGLSLVTRNKGRINGEISGNFGFTDNKLTTLSNRMQHISGKAKCSYADDHWKASIHAGYSLLMNRLDDIDICDLGFSVTYKFKRLEIWLQGTNLLNLNKTEWVQINMNPVYTSTTIYRKIPGSLLIGLAYRFSEAKEEPATMIIYN
ncbi:MAG: carboxypeptidase-like regulatory domain-containing protein [Bacteroidales bacterium]|nr:carboxypeptidase-like regulatory domain-containing protein [Bacteroidales bacterium]